MFIRRFVCVLALVVGASVLSGCGGAAAGSSVNGFTAGSKVQYRFERINMLDFQGLMGTGPKIDAQLNKLGNEGWHLDKVVPLKTVVVLVFQKPKP